MNSLMNRRLPDAESFLRYCETFKIKAKSTLVSRGDVADSLFLLIDGSISVIVDDDDQDSEQQMVVSYLNAGDFLGEMGLFGETERTATLVARSDCEIAAISYERFQQVRGQFPEIVFALMTQVGLRLRETTQRLADLTFIDVSGRLRRALFSLSGQPDAMTHPDGIQIRITRQELGKLVGCSREMAGRVLKALEEEGIVTVSGKTIVIRSQRQDDRSGA